jgi:hypothetical protein
MKTLLVTGLIGAAAGLLTAGQARATNPTNAWNYDPDGPTGPKLAPWAMVQASCARCHENPVNPSVRCQQLTGNTCAQTHYCISTSVGCNPANAGPGAPGKPPGTLPWGPFNPKGLPEWLRFDQCMKTDPTFLRRDSYYTPGQTKAQAMAGRVLDGTMPPGGVNVFDTTTTSGGGYTKYVQPWNVVNLQIWNDWVAAGSPGPFCPQPPNTDPQQFHYDGCDVPAPPDDYRWTDAQSFLSSQCTGCHDGVNASSQRYNWNDQTQVQDNACRILFKLTPAGNMPPAPWPQTWHTTVDSTRAAYLYLRAWLTMTTTTAH